MIQGIRKKKPRLVFHWRGGYLTREVVLEIPRLTQQAAESKGIYVTFSINWPQAVLQINFSNLPAQLTLGRENPNESEAKEDDV